MEDPIIIDNGDLFNNAGQSQQLLFNDSLIQKANHSISEAPLIPRNPNNRSF